MRIDGESALVPKGCVCFRARMLKLGAKSKCRPGVNIENIELEGFTPYRIGRGRMAAFPILFVRIHHFLQTRASGVRSNRDYQTVLIRPIVMVQTAIAIANGSQEVDRTFWIRFDECFKIVTLAIVTIERNLEIGATFSQLTLVPTRSQQ